MKVRKIFERELCVASDKYFSFKYFPKNAYVTKIISKIVRPVLAALSVKAVMLVTLSK